MGCPAQIINQCNHCGGEFTYSYLTTICPTCFLAGHRFSDCGPHCKTEPKEPNRAAANALLTLLEKQTISREVKRDYKAEFEQQLSLVGIQVEREFYFARPRKWRADFRVKDTKVLIEYEGGLFMESGGAHKAVANILRDIEKYNSCAIQGWMLIRITPKHVVSGQALKWVEDALKAIGAAR